MKTLSSCAAALLLAAASLLSESAAAETVTGTFEFKDGDKDFSPIRRAKVEIHRKRPNHLHWEVAATVYTDDEGRIRAAVAPFMGSGTRFTLRVYATNDAVVVYTKDNFLAHYYSQPGPPGQGIEHKSSSPGDELDFSWQFTEEFATGHFNAADAMLRGLEYARARRDPREAPTEPIATVAVQMTSQDASYYDPLIKVVRLNWSAAMSDASALHEYAHYLEERISGFTPIASKHNGCEAMAGAVNVASPNHAWMESFANYFSHAVRLQFGSLLNGPVMGTSDVETPECAGNTMPRSSLEKFVTAALQDLIDATNEKFDSSCMAGTAIDRIIFQIFDRELDIGGNPSLQHFVDAWAARGQDLPTLLKILDGVGITVNPRNPVVYFDRTPAANPAVWRPGAGAAQWHISGGQGGAPTWGEPGDIPVPGDYDGDSITDLAIWRPRDGNWWVVLSATGVTQITQWGTANDVPLPLDYDGDKETDFVVYRGSNNTFYFYNDNCAAIAPANFGSMRGTPFTGDFNKDGRTDYGLYDPPVGFVFRYAGSGTGTPPIQISAAEAPPASTTFASNRRELASPRPPVFTVILPLQPVIGDYDGDKLSDLAVWAPSSGMWTVQASARGRITRQWGTAGDIPVPADYDGDGSTDFAVWRPSTGEWWTYPLNGQGTVAARWGASGDTPIPAP